MNMDSILYNNFCHVVDEIVVSWTTLGKVRTNQNVKCYPGPLTL